MKTFGKLTFGVQAVQAGQKSSTINAEPQLIANSTIGKFVITSPVSKALNIAVGENVMFLNNIAAVEAAVQAKGEDVRALATELGVDIDTKAGEDALVDHLTQWYIAKGVLQYTSKGEPIMASERYTKEDKAKYLAEHAMELVEANRDALVEQFGEMSDEELAQQLTVDMVESPKYHAASGSKTATTASTTGVGCQLIFTDTAIWAALKKDLGDDASKKNRIYNVVLDDAQKAEFNNGKENVEITILPISFKEDVDPITRVKKEA
ncbi:MAG: hypothetical protein [crAssphage sp. isolate ctcc615]|uniref:Uncharacterized protein n=1 Tax=crAssphage sp. isolate ctcc615 TaxID=2989853 RepID=A0A345BP08_9CAUD|nr:MAG: hypothetical protein KNU00_gp25 [crAssphage sp. isolate ctcc615]AXF52179.1 MAG: hypothetical protein [crAssphage sp. isolate ctcc615]